jgi:hypothetical protein
MVDNQHTKIKGYRDLSEDEIALMNEVKGLSEQVGVLVEKINRMTTIDHRWLAIGRTDLQTGFMAVVRAIAQPTTF